MNNQILTKKKYRPEIDGIRAFAIIAVIINHFNKEILPSGYLGVDIFFVISGYVITSSLHEKDFKSLWEFLYNFFERRIRRLVPALVFFVTVTSVFICFFNPYPGFSLITGITSLFGLSNLYLIKQSTDYFAQSTEMNVFTHTWSLGVEEQFYVLFPFLIWFSDFRSKAKTGTNKFLGLILILTIFSFITFIFLFSTSPNSAYFFMPARFWEISTGSLVFLGINKKVLICSILEKIPVPITLLIMVLLMFLPINITIFSITFTVLSTSILLISLKKGKLGFNLFTNKKVVNFGLLSYSLYLWHWSIISISRWTIGIYWWTIPFQIILIYLISRFSYNNVESPFRLKRSIKKFKSFIYFAISIITSSLFITFLGKKVHSHIYLGQNDPDLYYRNIVIQGISNSACDFSSGKVFEENSDLEKCNFNNKDNFYKFSKSNNQSLYFLGSSHAGTLSGLIGQVSKQLNSNLYSLWVGGTFFPSLDSNFYPAGIYRENALRDNMNQKKIEKFILKNVNSGDVIVITNHLELFGTPSSPIKADHKKMVLNYFESLNKFTDNMNKLNVKIILFGPTPYFSQIKGGKNTKLCAKEWFRSNPFNCFYSIKRDYLLSSNMFLNNLSRNWDQNNINGFFFEPFDYLCAPSKNICQNRINESIYLYDRDHLNTYGGKVLSLPFINFLKSKKLLEF